MIFCMAMKRPIETVYEDKISNKVLAHDPSQASAIKLLSKINEDLTNRNKGFLSVIKKKQSLKGVYLWGGVGRGKSMVMDLFFEFTDIQKKDVFIFMLLCRRYMKKFLKYVKQVPMMPLNL